MRASRRPGRIGPGQEAERAPGSVTVPVYFHVIRSGTGVGDVTTAQINAQIAGAGNNATPGKREGPTRRSVSRSPASPAQQRRLVHHGDTDPQAEKQRPRPRSAWAEPRH